MTMRMSVAALCVAGWLVAMTGARACHAQTPTAHDLLQRMDTNEAEAARNKSRDRYVSVERSERTGGHLWTERVVETSVGRIRCLLAVDGQVLDAEATARERGRLAAILADPSQFTRVEAAQKDDELHARQMLGQLGTGFLLSDPRREGTDWRIDYRPDPAYAPSGLEGKVLHGMSGTLLIDADALRLQHVDGHLAHDVSLGFGLLATVHEGSHFETTKAIEDGQWRTINALTDIQGKAGFFKTLSHNQAVTRSDFHTVPDGLTLAQAVSLAEAP